MASAADMIGGIQTFFPAQTQNNPAVTSTNVAQVVQGSTPTSTAVNTSTPGPTLAVTGTPMASATDTSPLKINTDTLILIGVILSIIVAVRGK